MNAPPAADSGRDAATNVLSALLLKLLQYPFMLLFLAFIPRWMGPDIYGEYAVWVSVVSIAAAAIGIGASTELFGRHIPRLASQGEAEVARFVGTLFVVKASIGLLAGFALGFVLESVYGSRWSTAMVVVAVGAIWLRDLHSVGFAFLFGLDRLAAFASEMPLRRVMSFPLVGVGFLLWGLEGAILGFLGVEIALAALSFGLTRKEWNRFIFDFSALRPVLGLGSVFYGVWMVQTVWERSGNLILDWSLNDPAQVAVFDLANQLFLLASSFLSVLIGSFLPSMTRLEAAGRGDAIRAWSQRLTGVSTIGAVAFLWVLVLAGPWVLEGVLGPGYEAASSLAVVLSIGLFPLIVTQFGVLFSVLENRPAVYWKAMVASVAAYWVLAIALSPKFGATGCAIASVSSWVLLAALTSLNFRGAILPCFRSAVRPAFLGAIFLPVLVWLPADSWHYAAVPVMAGYAVLLVGTRVLIPREMAEIVQQLGSGKAS